MSVYNSVVEDKIKSVKVIVSEADGVLTNGKASFDALGNAVFKEFNLCDFEYINLLKRTFTFVVLSSDSNITYHVCRKRHIPFYYVEDNDKLSYLHKIRNRYSVTPDEIMYIGSRLSDLQCMRLVPLSGCLMDASEEVKRVSLFSLNTVGGDRAIKALYESLKSEIERRNKLTK